MCWLIASDYMCHTWPQICSVCRNHNPVLSHSRLITGFITRATRRVAHVERLSSLPFFICISGVHGVAVVKLHVLTCFIPCCDLRFDFPIKRCSIRLDLCVVLCVVNEIRLSSHILASSSTKFQSDDVRVVIKKHDRYLMWSRNTVISLWVPEFTLASWSLGFCIMSCRPLIIILSFFFGHCIVCPSSYGFWLSLWYPQTFYVKTILTLFFVCFIFFALFFRFFWLPFCLSFQSSLMLIQQQYVIFIMVKRNNF
jgi:hypothetical protein